MKVLTYILLLFLITLSCSKSKEYTISFDDEKLLVSDTILLKEIMHPSFMSIKNQNLIISSNKSDTMIFFYSLPNVEYTHKMGIKGNGPDDMLFPMFCESTSDDLYIWGYANLLKIKRFSIESLANIQFKNEYYLDKYLSFNQMHVIKDSLLIYSAIPSEFSIKKYDLINSILLDEIKIKTEDHDENFSIQTEDIWLQIVPVLYTFTPLRNRLIYLIWTIWGKRMFLLVNTHIVSLL